MRRVQRTHTETPTQRQKQQTKPTKNPTGTNSDQQEDPSRASTTHEWHTRGCKQRHKAKRKSTKDNERQSAEIRGYRIRYRQRDSGRSDNADRY